MTRLPRSPYSGAVCFVSSMTAAFEAEYATCYAREFKFIDATFTIVPVLPAATKWRIAHRVPKNALFRFRNCEVPILLRRTRRGNRDVTHLPG